MCGSSQIIDPTIGPTLKLIESYIRKLFKVRRRRAVLAANPSPNGSVWCTLRFYNCFAVFYGVILANVVVVPTTVLVVVAVVMTVVAVVVVLVVGSFPSANSA